MKKLFLLLILLPYIARAMDREESLPLALEISTTDSSIPLATTEIRTDSSTAQNNVLSIDLLKQQFLAFITALSTGRLALALLNGDTEFAELAIAPSALFSLAVVLEILQKPSVHEKFFKYIILAAALMGSYASLPAILRGSFAHFNAELVTYGFSILLLGALATGISFCQILKESASNQTAMELIQTLTLSAIAGLSLGEFCFDAFKHEFQMTIMPLIPLVFSVIACIFVHCKIDHSCFQLAKILISAFAGAITIFNSIGSLAGIIMRDGKFIFSNATVSGLALLATIASNRILHSSQSQYERVPQESI